ncbi:VanW family protein [Actinokineospora globicatena]|uniref:VanW family protein n=1 Tax=Actinokineospora globicatena TaxID=103729 RepID=UPI0020A29298|nr:VanW family protein [Actinokineospora globicatena]MCP2301366.1 Vancomycin resistance protein YoaR, contains peptidoglycan-binding and VanW domains [Actinokineospora globicatena]GLW76995.1 vanomycin resistance protein VanB [Actinokineospora globicatena]GLW83829.1 vanomycin resistance protein VanB [Actinokineospora globicatena]
MPQDQDWPDGARWPESHTEQTDLLPRVPQHVGPQSVGSPLDGPTEKLATPTEQQDEEQEPAKGKSFRKPAIIAGAVVGALAVLYGLDLAISSGDVPRGTTVAGVEVGGMSQVEAERELRDKIEPRLTQPVSLKIGAVEEKLDPARSGLTLNWGATLEQAGDQPLNPFTRLSSLFGGTREVGVVTSTDDEALTGAIDRLKQAGTRAPAEGGIRFDGATPVAVEPAPGQELDTAKARSIIIDGWADGGALTLPVTSTPVKTTPEGVHAALEVAKVAVSGPVVVKGDGKDAKIEPAVIAAALTFEPVDGGGLNPKVDLVKVTDAVKPQLAPTEKEGKDAQVVFEGGAPTVTPSVDGTGVKYDTAFATLLDVLKKPDGREIKVEYTKAPAKVTTEQANQLGIKEVIGEFTTKGFATDSGINIRTVAAKVNGAIVKPGETFSLNGFTGPRTSAQGYVEAGVIKDGAPGREVGGGISQFATTLYNAAYFSGLKDAGHKEHSYYISRYPAAREATVFQNHDGSSVIDLKFTNDAQTGVAIQTIWTSGSITVKIWGTKRYDVESITGGRSAETAPQEKPGPTTGKCSPSNGAPGFTTSDTRVLREAGTGREIRRDTRTVRYNPQPKIVCGPPPAVPPPAG